MSKIPMLAALVAGHVPFEQEPPADTILGIKAVIDGLLEKQPRARVILHPIFPRGHDTAKSRAARRISAACQALSPASGLAAWSLATVANSRSAS